MRYVAGYTASGMGGDSAGDWSAMLAAAVRLKTDSVWPAYSVVSVGGPALLPRPDGPARRRRLQEGREPSPVPPYRNAPTAAANVIGSTETFVRALQLQVPGICPVIESVVPLQDASRAGLAACRDLSESLRLVAKDNGALFLDVEMIVRRHLAGGDARPSRPAGGTQRQNESRSAGDVAAQSAESAAPMETEAEADATEGGGDGEEATLAANKSAAAAEAVFQAASAASLSASDLADTITLANTEGAAAADGGSLVSRATRVAGDTEEVVWAAMKAVEAATTAASATAAAAAAVPSELLFGRRAVGVRLGPGPSPARFRVGPATVVRGLRQRRDSHAAVRRELWRVIVTDFKSQ